MIRLAASGQAQQSEIWRARVAKTVAFAAPLVIGLVVILMMQQVRTADALRQAERAVEKQRVLLQTVLSAHQDIETGARGYVITGKPPYLEPYDQGRRHLQSVWPLLRRNFAGNPADAATIEKLYRRSLEKQAISENMVTARRGGNKAAAEAYVMSGEGKAVMDEIRDLIQGLAARQRNRLDATSRRLEMEINQQRLRTYVLLGALTLMLISAWLAFQNSLKLRDNALSEVEDHLLRRKAILDSAMDGILTLNPSGSIESANAATLRMFGYAEGELDRRDAGMLFASQPPIGKVAEYLQQLELEDSNEGTAQEVLGRRSDGTEFPTEVALSATVLNEGLRYVAVIRDVTERKRVEQLKTEFVSTVSHELRTPLTSISGALGLLASGVAGPLSERSERLITIAHTNAQRLVRLINDILDIEKIESGMMPFNNQELDLKAVVTAAIDENRSFAAKFDVKFSFSAPMAPMRVNADSDRLAQVLTNLLSNACKFSPAGGTVSVSIGFLGPLYRITIADQGPGIPEQFRDRIFGKFAQADSSDSREKGGTGLGLSIVREIVRRLDGHVSFDSKAGHGTRFHVDLPAVRRPAGHSGHVDVRSSLLVCGNGAGTTFSAALRDAGHDVTFVKDAESARSAIATGRFGGIVVDMGLKNGLGIEVIRMAREAGPGLKIPLLAIGGKPGSSALDGDAALVLDWLRKPIEVRRLVDSVEAVASRLDAEKPRVLHVEDDPDVARLVAAALEDRVEVVAAEGVAAARQMLAKERFDLVILDISLADGSGIEVLPELHQDQDKPPLPVVIFSAQDADPETAGLVDAYLTKARTPIDALVALVQTLTVGRAAAKQTS